VGLAAFNASTPPAPLDSVGTAVPGHEIMICDKAGRALPDGTCGEIMIRGPGMFSGYVNAPERSCMNGWFASGDTGVMEDGVLFIRGRSCSVIHVAGMKVFPEEIEACLMAHPAVGSARVYAVSHRRMGHIIIADIQPVSGETVSEKGLYLHCRRYLSPWKIPVEFNMDTRIGRTASGKVKRRVNTEE
jgi:long-chain acyl-CoA synthetase